MPKLHSHGAISRRRFHALLRNASSLKASALGTARSLTCRRIGPGIRIIYFVRAGTEVINILAAIHNLRNGMGPT